LFKAGEEKKPSQRKKTQKKFLPEINQERINPLSKPTPLLWRGWGRLTPLLWRGWGWLSPSPSGRAGVGL